MRSTRSCNNGTKLLAKLQHKQCKWHVVLRGGEHCHRVVALGDATLVAAYARTATSFKSMAVSHHTNCHYDNNSVIAASCHPLHMHTCCLELLEHQPWQRACALQQRAARMPCVHAAPPQQPRQLRGWLHAPSAMRHDSVAVPGPSETMRTQHSTMRWRWQTT